MIVTYMIGVVTGGLTRHHGPPMTMSESQVTEAQKRGLL